MLIQLELEVRVNLASSRIDNLRPQFEDHPLFREYCSRLANADSSIAKVIKNQSNNDETPAQNGDIIELMNCSFNLNRCDAIISELSDENSRDGNVTAQDNVLQTHHDLILLRWMISRLSLMRSKILGYDDYYRSPPLIEALKVSASGKAGLRQFRSRLNSIMRGF